MITIDKDSVTVNFELQLTIKEHSHIIYRSFEMLVGKDEIKYMTLYDQANDYELIKLLVQNIAIPYIKAQYTELLTQNIRTACIVGQVNLLHKRAKHYMIDIKELF